MKKIKNKKLKVIIIVFIVIIFFVLCYFMFNIFINMKLGAKNIEKNALEWYQDHNGTYDKTTIGALYKNGYIDKNDSECRVIKFNSKGDKAKLTFKNDCNYNKIIRDYPTLILNLKEVDSGKDYKEGTWTSSDIEVNYSFKNNSIDSKMIDRVYLAKSNGEELDNMIISTQDFIKDTYSITVDLKDSNHYYRDMEIKIDKTGPYFVKNERRYSKFDDDESGIEDVYYHYSESKDLVPKKIDEFVSLDDISMENGIRYYIWSIGVNRAGVYSDIQYVGEYENVVKEKKSKSSVNGDSNEKVNE